MKRATKEELAPQLADEAIGHEARAGRDDHASLRLWLRLLSCTTEIEAEIRRRLRAEFGMTLARFDYLAQLHRHPDGLRMRALSSYLMVTGGNVTGLTDELEKLGHVQRSDDPDDRRSYRVALTPKGRKAFEKMARIHEGWIAELFDGLPAGEKGALHESLGRLRLALAPKLKHEGTR